MDSLLDGEKIDQCFVYDRVRPMPSLIQQTAESVLHCTGSGGKNVSLYRGQVDDVFTQKPLWYVKSIGIDLIQTDEFVGELTDGIPDVHPFLTFVEMDIPEPVGFHNVDLFVLPFTEMGVDDHGAVVAGVEQIRSLSVLPHRPNNSVKLPGRGGTARVEEMPGDVHFQGGVDIS